MKFFNGKCQAFTLVELLAVIAVIAILMGILLPGIQKVRQRGTEIKCLANMRQWGSGTLLFLGDNQGVFPEQDNNSSGTPPNYNNDSAWYNSLAEHVGIESLYSRSTNGILPNPMQDRSLFTCPGAMSAIMDPTVDLTVAVFCYGLNVWLDNSARGVSRYGKTLRQSQLIKPAKTVLFAEILSSLEDTSQNSDLNYRHNGTNSMNIGFVDGHVENISRQQLTPSSGTAGISDNIGVIWDPDGNPVQEDF